MIRKKKPATKIQSTRLPRIRSSRSIKEQDDQLGAELQAKRVSLGLTQRVMSELCQLQIATIAKIEKGDPGVRLGTLRAYLDAINLKLSIQDKELK